MSGDAPQSGEKPSEAVPPLAGGSSHRPRVAVRFLDELKHRNIVRVGILYVIVAWLILEPVHVIFHMLETPAWANRAVIVLLAIGFPAALLFAWVYEITPEGLKPTVKVEPSQSIRNQTRQRLNRAIIAVLVLAMAYLLVDKIWLSKYTASERRVGTVVPAVPPAAPAISDKSVAVLPFVDMSEKKDQEYFSDGLSEELIDRLSHSEDLRVISRTSSFFFKGKQVTIAEIAKTLGVGHVLEGSVRKSGQALRITAQLIRASDGRHAPLVPDL
jgi:TolB-like protein